MKKKELKKRIEDGFSQLAPDMFEAVMEAAEEENIVWSQKDSKRLREQEKRGIRPRYALSFCTCLAMICMCIFGIFSEKQNHVFMVLDINPSIRVEVNEFRQVESLKGLNQDGKDVVKELKWKKRESVQELLDVLIQDVVEKSYLRDNEGILVTLSASRQDICENLERTLEEGIDRKLTELKVSGVTTAFRQTQSRTEKEGRKMLETELVKCSDLDEEQAQKLSVRELIQYCQDYTSLDLKLSGASNKAEDTQIQQNMKEPQTQNAISSGDGEKNNPEDKKADEKKQEEKKAEKKESEEKGPEQVTEENKSNKTNSQDNTGSGNTEVQDGKKKKGDNSCKQETPNKQEEQAKPEGSSNKESITQPDNSEKQEDVPKSDNSGEQEDVPKPDNSEEPGDIVIPDNSEEQEIGPKPETPSKPENPSKPEIIEIPNNPPITEDLKIQETTPDPEKPEVQKDIILPEYIELVECLEEQTLPDMKKKK